MNSAMRLDPLRSRFLRGWRKGAISRKAVSFALIGVVNALVDYGVFFVARAAFAQWPTALALFAAISGACRCAGADTVSFIAANLTSWAVAMTGSYILNASITFAAESGRKLRWRAYAVFAASGIAGWLANTAALVFAAQVLLLSIALAKAVAILASFAVNFTLSHYVVFRGRHRPALDVCEDI
jgi:putative flippase GtrA